MSVFEEWSEKIKVIVSEVDGVITDHISCIDELGNVPFKCYYMKDFEFINELKKTFTFVFLSSDNAVSYHLCRRKNIPFYYAPKDKKGTLIKIMRKYNITPEEVIYIGSSFSDLECIQMIPFSLCPVDAVNDAKTICYHVLDNYGGGGVLEDVYSLLKPEILRRKRLTN